MTRIRVPGTTARSAYTLIEIMLVMALIALLLGTAVPLVSGFSREQKLRDVVRELLVMAKTARTDAVTTGHAAEIVFGKRAFSLRRSDETEPGRTETIPAGMAYTLRAFGAEKAQKPDGQRWVFQPSGLCEPITVRVVDDDAWMEVRFDPLTAGIAEESFYAP